jgi:hypothetical protein
MTVPTEETGGYTTYADEDIVEQPYIPPIPVRIAQDRREQASHFGSLQGWTIPLFSVAGAQQPPVQITRRRPPRNRTVIYNPQYSNAGATVSFSGNEASPVTVGGVIATSPALAAGTYLVSIATILTGTPTFADANNVALQLNGVTIAVIPVQGSSEQETVTPSPDIVVQVPAGGILRTVTIGLGGGTASYNNTVYATPTGPTNAQVLLATNPDQLQLSTPVGYPLDSGVAVTLESQQPVYAIMAPGALASVTIGVLDEAWESKDGN